jgi:hypothetical protein
MSQLAKHVFMQNFSSLTFFKSGFSHENFKTFQFLSLLAYLNLKKITTEFPQEILIFQNPKYENEVHQSIPNDEE